MHSKIRPEIGTWPNGSLYDKTAGWRFQKLYSRQTMLAGLLGEMPFGEFLAAGNHGVGVLNELQVMRAHTRQPALPFHIPGRGCKHMRCWKLAMVQHDTELPFGGEACAFRIPSGGIIVLLVQHGASKMLRGKERRR